MGSVLGKECVERRVRWKSGFEGVEHGYWMNVQYVSNSLTERLAGTAAFFLWGSSNCPCGRPPTRLALFLGIDLLDHLLYSRFSFGIPSRTPSPLRQRCGSRVGAAGPQDLRDRGLLLS